MAYPLPSNETSRLASLHELAIMDTEPEQIYDDIVALAAAICQVPAAVINFVDEDRQWGKALIGYESTDAPREASFCARTIVGDDVLEICDTLADPEWAENPMVLDEPSLRFYAGAPIVTSDGCALGAVCVTDSAPNQLDERQREALRILARQTAAHLEMRRLAVRDALTGLPNRTLLADRLGLALAQRNRLGTDLGVLFCDLDGFKAVNDTHGHEAGDEVLRAVAARMDGAGRLGDTVARLAGDEFVVICPGLTTPADLELVAARLRFAVAAPVAVPGGHVTPRVSVGAAIAQDGDTPASLLRRADAAMYDAKRATAA